MIGTDLTKGSVSKTLLRFTVPFLAANVLHTLYSIVDLFIVGRFTDSIQMSAVSVSSLLMLMINAFVMGFGTGSTVLIGQMAGAKREKDLEEMIATVFTALPILSLLLMVLCFLLRRPLLTLINTPAETYDAAEAYLRICLYGLLFTGMYTAIASILRGMGDSKGPTIFVACACLLNIAGDYVCVKVLDMGAAGAALATSVAQGCSVVFGFIYLKRRSFPFGFRLRSFRIYRDKLRGLLRVGIPTSFQDTMTNLSFLVLEAIINAMGYVAVAAAGVCDRVFTVAVVPSLAFSAAISAMVAQNTGAGEHARGRKCLRIGVSMSFAVGIIIWIIMWLLPGSMIGLFTKDTAVIGSGVEYMTWYKFEFLFCTIAFCLNGYINGTGHTRYTLLLNTISAFAVRLPLIWFISRMAGATLREIGLGLPIATIVQSCLGLGFLLFAKSERAPRKQRAQ